MKETISSRGYVYISGVEFRDHPLSTKMGRGPVARHRLVCWTAIGQPDVNQADTPCWICGWYLPWRGYEIPAWRYVVNVDHLNGKPGDDRPENLKPACWWCNSNRGWLSQVFPDWFDILLAFGGVEPNGRPNLLLSTIRAVRLWQQRWVLTEGDE